MKKTKKVVLGIDPSLTHTGWAAVEEGGRVISSGVIKSKPSGDKPIDELKRIYGIIQEIEKLFWTRDDEKACVDRVVMEGLAFSARNTTALVQLAALNYGIRYICFKVGMPFVIVAPTSLKKFITGSGKGDKDQMQMQVYKNYGFEGADNNEADAYALAVTGLAILGKPLKKPTIPQQEVIILLKKQL